MLPRDLKAENFAKYPPEARAIVVDHLEGLRRLPLAFVPGLLREAIDYDYRFPVERSVIKKELEVLGALSDADVSKWFAGLAGVSVSRALESFDWVNLPAQFVEQEAAYLWSTHQLDTFRTAAKEYGDRLDHEVNRAEPLPLQRLGIAVIGQGVSTYDAPLMKNLRKHGTYFSNVKPDGGLATLLAAVEKRAEKNPAAYAHWYVDGGSPAGHSARITAVSYEVLAPLRNSLLKRMQSEIDRPGMGPEELRTVLARLTPADFAMENVSDPVLSRFELKLFTEGSGTQIYSTTFAQWTAREILRRAQPLTLLVRFAPRQRQRPMNELLSGSHGEANVDPTGSLVDAEMGAYYHWLDQQRLPGAEQSAFLAWFEGHRDAVVIGPSMPRGTESQSEIDLEKLLSLVSV
jgi:hypothetical protein